MIVINTVNAERFSLDGIEYFKNFTPVVAGDTIRILNTYGACFDLLKSTNYADFIVNGSTYASSALLQSALLPVIYTRSSLGVAIPDSSSITSNIATTYNIDWSVAGNWDLTLTANTTLTESNIPSAGVEKTITIYAVGVFSLTLPVGWVIKNGGSYDGLGQQIVVQSWNNGNYYTVIN